MHYLRNFADDRGHLIQGMHELTETIDEFRYLMTTMGLISVMKWFKCSNLRYLGVSAAYHIIANRIM